MSIFKYITNKQPPFVFTTPTHQPCVLPLAGLIVKEKGDHREGKGFYVINSGETEIITTETENLEKRAGEEKKEMERKEMEGERTEGQRSWGLKAEMYEFVCKTGEVRSVWLQVLKQAVSGAPETGEKC